MAKRTIILGIDGGTWRVFDRLFAAGKMKNFQKIIQDGVRAELESTMPPVTGPAWVSFATGKNPGKHGCFDFTFPDGSLANLRTISTDNINAKTVYEYLEENGRKSILINLPVSYPPRTENITITSLMTKGENCVFPKTLLHEIPLLKKYRITPDMELLAQGKVDEYIEDIREVEKIRFQVGKELFQRDWDLFFILFSGTDWIQHIKLDYLLTGDLEENNPILKYFDDLDEYLGWFFQIKDDEDDLIIISDHGFKQFQGTFFINEWLHQRGYLQLKKKSATQIESHQVVKNLENAFDKKWKRFSLPAWVRKLILSNMLLNKLAIRIYRLLRDRMNLQLRAEVEPNFSRTMAYATSGELCGLYLNRQARFRDGMVAENDCENLKLKIMDELKKLVDDEGEPVFVNVLAKEDVYHGEKFDHAPDILLKSDRYWIRSSFSAQIFDKMPVFNHEPTGIFAAVGTSFSENNKSNRLNLTDIVPLVFYLLNLPIPDDLDGKLPVSLIQPGLFSKRKPRYFSDKSTISSKLNSKDQSDNLVTGRLRGLGYLE